MRVKAITPMHVGAEEIERRQRRYDRLAPAGMTITLFDLPASDGTPVALETADDIRASETLVIEAAMETDPAQFDAILPDCVLDPGVPELDRRSPLPVLGITRLAAGLLASLGRRFAAVTRNKAIGEEFEAVIARYGLSSLFTGVEVLGLSVTDIANDAIWNAAVAKAAATVTQSGAATILNGCSAVEVTESTTGVSIVDPTALALSLAGHANARGLLSTSERGLPTV